MARSAFEKKVIAGVFAITSISYISGIIFGYREDILASGLLILYLVGIWAVSGCVIAFVITADLMNEKKNTKQRPLWQLIVMILMINLITFFFMLGIVKINRPTGKDHLPLENDNLNCEDNTDNIFCHKKEGSPYKAGYKSRVFMKTPKVPNTLHSVRIRFSHETSHDKNTREASLEPYRLRYMGGYNPSTYGLFPSRKKEALVWFELAMPGVTHFFYNGTERVDALMVIEDAKNTKGAPLAYALPPSSNHRSSHLNWTVVAVSHPEQPLFTITSSGEGNSQIHFRLLLAPEEWSSLSTEAARVHEVMSKYNFWAALAVAWKAYSVPPSNHYGASSNGWHWVALVFGLLWGGIVIVAVMHHQRKHRQQGSSPDEENLGGPSGEDGMIPLVDTSASHEAPSNAKENE